MKKLALTLCLLVCLCGALQAQTIARWTFETSLPAGTPGAATWLTNISAEVGQGVASGWHAAAAAVYTSPSGNGSAHSFSANTWTTGDFFQFAVSTAGYNNIGISYDQVSSGTGPAHFLIQYSTDGSAFTQFGNQYTVAANTSPNNWSATNSLTTTSYSLDLSPVTSLNDSPTVYVRLVQADTTSANGGTVATGGTSRVDNFAVFEVPEPQTLSLMAAGLALLVCNRSRRGK